MERPLRVLLVSPLPPPAGGIARWTSLVTGYAGGRGDVRIAVVDTALRWRSIHNNSSAARIAAGFPQLIGCSMRLLEQARKGLVDVVHINSSGQFGIVRDYLLARIARSFRIPVVYHIRFGRIPDIAEKRTREWRAFAAVARRAQAVIALDRDTQVAVAQRIPSVPVELVPNCVDPASVKSGTSRALPPGNANTALFVGWVIPAKGVRELFEVWHEASPADWRLIVVGSYDEAYISSLNLPPAARSRIDLRGELPHQDVLALMGQCRFLVHPSHTEGFPNVIAEAMILGKPVLSTAVGAIPDMLSDGCGVVIPPQDAGQLAEAIRAMIANEESRERMGRSAARKAHAEYTVGGVFARYLDIWKKAAG